MGCLPSFSVRGGGKPNTNFSQRVKLEERFAQLDPEAYGGALGFLTLFASTTLTLPLHYQPHQRSLSESPMTLDAALFTLHFVRRRNEPWIVDIYPSSAGPSLSTAPPVPSKDTDAST